MGYETQHAKISPLKTFTAHELQHKDMPPLQFVVDEILPEGLAVLVAPPKYGKSWMAQQLCAAISSGTVFLGFTTVKGTTLYMALESSERQLQDRQEAYFAEVDAPDNLYMVTTAERIGSGLIQQIEQFLKEHADTVLIVIDLLAKIRPDTEGKNRNAYYTDYKDMEPLKSLADKHRICVLVLHHTNKAKDETDFINTISGSNGIAGSADTVLGIHKPFRADETATMIVFGRDVKMQDFPIVFDPNSCLWKRTNAPIIPTVDPLVKQICTFMAELDEWRGTLSELAQATGNIGNTDSFAKSTGRHLPKIRNQLIQNGIDYERIAGRNSEYRFFKKLI